MLFSKVDVDLIRLITGITSTVLILYLTVLFYRMKGKMPGVSAWVFLIAGMSIILVARVLSLLGTWRLVTVYPNLSDILLMVGMITVVYGMSLWNKQALKMVHRLTQDSVTDPLTHAYNRRFLNDRLGPQLTQPPGLVKHQGRFALALLDLDNFKQLNDKYGHLCGDRILQAVTESLGNSVRDHDVIVRYGGDEFAIIFPDADSGSRSAIIDRINEAISHVRLPDEDQQLTASIGIAFYPDDGYVFDDLVKVADDRMYAVKDS